MVFKQMKKSRLIVSGDFILFNSMSFGKPYIMDTTGAIYDRWLLLRDNYKILDKAFLYHILSSLFVFTQFSNLATA
jgi:type I restriction enzyme S subunit